MLAHKNTENNFEENNEIATAESVIDPQYVPFLSTGSSAGAYEAEGILDIPDDVKKSLIGYENMEMDSILLEIVGSFSSSVSVDKIILALWHRHKKKIERMKLIRRLRMMAADGIIEKVDGTRGNYIITQAGMQFLG